MIGFNKTEYILYLLKYTSDVNYQKQKIYLIADLKKLIRKYK